MFNLKQLDYDNGSLVSVFVILIAYASTFVSSTLDSVLAYSTGDVVLLLVLGAVHLALSLFEHHYFRRFPGVGGKIVFFVAQSALVLSIVVIANVGAMWLLGLPLVGTAVEYLTPLWRWPIYAVAVGCIALPVTLLTGWENGLYQALVFSPAVVFVVFFVKLTQQADKQRQEAEALADQLEDANRQLAAYAVQAEELAISEERNRLAREIHDNLGHYLTVVNVQIEAAKVLMPQDQTRSVDALDKAQSLTQEGLRAVRHSVAALRADVLDNRPIPAAIDALLEALRAAGVHSNLTVTADPRPLEARTELTLYRVAQEGLTNVRRHACASRVDVLLDYSRPDVVTLRIADNGVGSDSAENGFGLLGMRERLTLVGGHLTIETAPRDGFTLTATVPG